MVISVVSCLQSVSGLINFGVAAVAAVRAPAGTKYIRTCQCGAAGNLEWSGLEQVVVFGACYTRQRSLVGAPGRRSSERWLILRNLLTTTNTHAHKTTRACVCVVPYNIRYESVDSFLFLTYETCPFWGQTCLSFLPRVLKFMFSVSKG